MQIHTREGIVGNKPSSGGSTVISANPKKEKEMLDKFGNVIDPRTKQVIKQATA